MATVDFGERFSPAEATRGQFVPIDSSTLVGYPTGDSEGVSRGRYAELTYLVGSEPGALNIALSGGNVVLPVSSVNISEPVRIENEPGDRIDVTIQEPISAIVTNEVTVTEAIPSTTFVYASTVNTGSTHQVTFPFETTLIEVANTGLSAANTITTASVLLSSSAGFGGPSTYGVPVRGRLNTPGYYSITYAATGLFFEVDTDQTRVRVLVHR
jgi:hypothetical protein